MRGARGLIGNNSDAPGAEIQVRSDEIELVEGREIVDQRQSAAVCGKLQNAVAVIRPCEIRVEGAVSGGNINVPARIRCRSCPRAPDPRSPAVRSTVEGLQLLQRGGVIGQQPTMIVRRIAERSKGNV